MAKKLLWIFSVVGVTLMLTNCQSKEEKKEVSKYLVSKPMQKDTIVSKDYVCQIHAFQHIELRSLEAGYLKHIYVDEGQFVKQGQSMFKVMPNVYEADVQKMKAEANLAQIEYNNTKLLADKNVVSPNELALAKAKLDKAKAELQMANTHLGFTDVKAPFSGIMDKLHAREGSLLEEGELLTTLSNNSKMWVYFNVPEIFYLNYMTKKTKGEDQKVRLRLANGEFFNQEGNIETIEGEFNNETGNIEFRATFQNPDKILRHGQTGNVVLDSQVKNAILIPQKATFEVLARKYVFVVDNKNVVHQKQIEVSENELPYLFIVTKGLTKDDKILLDGLRKVKDGETIEVDYQEPAKVFSNLELEAE
ncbi:efflux RND transporter periplasmic adaptor subunit [Flavobacterium sp.]|uniref:efflux RND transporter periplasmic adaptor subunit n=1 Tax=Flavobacterium sp. TaxID=239 RepID=UPI0035291CC9